MKIFTRTLLALALAGTTAQLAACGDDNGTDGDNNPGDGDAGLGDGDGDKGDAGDGDGDGGLPPPPDKCPTHPNVREEPTVCVLTGAPGAEVKQDLTMGPVKNKEGWVLEGGVFVGEDVGFAATPDATKKAVTLTVLPGTTVFGKTDLSFLLIQRGSKLIAKGTATAPITFTSYQTPGTEDRGDWGGIVLNGRAPVNAGANVQGEAGTGWYGGPDVADNSGTLEYVRVYYGGGKVDSMNELNGIAFQGVGNGTKVEYVHVHANDDDGVEFFGGTANVKHLVVTGVTDDSIDWTSGWRGHIQYALVKQLPDIGDNGIEADNTDPTSSAEPVSNPTLSNLTFISPNTAQSAFGVLLRRGTNATVANAIVTGFKKGCVSYQNASPGRVSNSRIFCDPMFEMDSAAGTEKDAAANRGEFSKPEYTNTVLAAAPVFTSGYLAPADALTGAVIPADAADFAFDDVTFVGAFGSEDWTAGWTESKFIQ